MTIYDLGGTGYGKSWVFPDQPFIPRTTQPRLAAEVFRKANFQQKLLKVLRERIVPPLC